MASKDSPRTEDSSRVQSPVCRSIESPRHGGYNSAPFNRQSIGPEAEFEAQLKTDDSDLSEDAHLRSLVYEFPEGCPDRLRGTAWSRLLGVGNDGIGLLEFMSAGNLDEANQRVIRSDVERTRANITFFRMEETRIPMEQILTYFCKVKGIKYKQGLNEVLAPFFYLKSDVFDFNDIYKCFSVFVNRFLPLFADDEFTTLQCSFILFKQLLTYHDPSLSLFLEYHGVSPELYVTPWFLTLFASKLQINHILCLWDFYIAKGDRLFFCFIALALMLEHRDEIFLTEVSQLPETLTHIGIQTYSELRKVWRSAKSLQQNTPTSFGTRMSAAQGNKFPLNQTLFQLESEGTFHILPQEVLRHCYGLHSPNPLSSNPSLRLWKLLLLDIRPRSQFDSGRLPPAVSLDMSSPDWRDRIIDLTASACSVPLGASPQAIAARARRPSDPGATKISGQGFEDMGDGEVKVGVKRGIEKVQLPSLNYHICVMAGDDSEAESRLADHLCYILTRELFLKWVSISHGGFKEAHRLALQSSLELIDHQPVSCSVCSTIDTTKVPQQKPKKASTTSAFFPGFVSSSKRSTQPPSLLTSPNSRWMESPNSLTTDISSTVVSEDNNNNSSNTPIQMAQTIQLPIPQPTTSSFSLMGALRFVRPGVSVRKRDEKDLENREKECRITGISREGKKQRSPSIISASFQDISMCNSPKMSPSLNPDSPDICSPNVLTTAAYINRRKDPTLKVFPDGRPRAQSTPPDASRHDTFSNAPPSRMNGPLMNAPRMDHGTRSSTSQPSASQSCVSRQMSPYFISSAGPPTPSCRISPIVPAHWRVLGNLFQRLAWDEVLRKVDVYLIPCEIESLKLDETSKAALLKISSDTESTDDTANTANATAGAEVSLVSPPDPLPKNLDKERCSHESKVKSVDDLSFFVPDTRPCQLLIVGEELAVVSTPYSRELSIGTKQSDDDNKDDAFVLVYATYALSEIVKITSKKATPNTLYFYFTDQKVSLRLLVQIP